MIYDYCVESKRVGLYLPQWYQLDTPKFSNYRGLVQVCQQIRAEFHFQWMSQQIVHLHTNPCHSERIETFYPTAPGGGHGYL